MVKPRHPAAAAAELARRQRCALALMAAGCLSLFVITSITFHGIISDEDYVDDGIAGLGVDGAANNHNRKKQSKTKLPKKRMDGDVDLNYTYQSVRDAHDERYPPNDVKRLKSFAQSLRTHDIKLPKTQVAP